MGENKKHDIKIEELIKTLDSLVVDYLCSIKKNLKEKYFSSKYDRNRENKVLDLHKLYFKKIIDQLKSYLLNNLYKDTRSENFTDFLNRNTVFHLFEKGLNFSLSDYLRVYNCFFYFAWALSSINKNDVFLSSLSLNLNVDKLSKYLNIIRLSEKITPIKSELFEREIESYIPYLDEKYTELIKNSSLELITIEDIWWHTTEGIIKKISSDE